MSAVFDTKSVTPTFTDNGRKARYGIAYLKTICAQAGVTFVETPADEDVMAIDAEIRFPRLTSRVQVKCTSKYKLAGRSLTMALEPTWVHAWEESECPVYFVVVVVPQSIPEWIEHAATSTKHRAAAYWVRFDNAVHTKSISVPKSQRFTIATLHEWKADVDRLFDEVGVS